jgi:hypothetical protein
VDSVTSYPRGIVTEPRQAGGGMASIYCHSYRKKPCVYTASILVYTPYLNGRDVIKNSRDGFQTSNICTTRKHKPDVKATALM